MNRIFTRDRLLRRTAAATAAIVGALLITTTDTASAQETGIDCAALGERPAASGLEAALSAADQCQVEVRVNGRIMPYTTMYATPEGLLHLVQTVAPSQGYLTQPSVDMDLELWEGSLYPAYSPFPFNLRYDDPEAHLLWGDYGWLEWDGEVPVPAYSGTTAVYDELAPGLDFTVDVGASSAELDFTIADADAWNSLVTGLSPGSYRGLELSEDGLEFVYDQYEGVLEGTSRFLLRDTDGDLLPVEPTLSADGSFTLELAADALAEAEFPLSLSTQWVQRNRFINEWGSTTSAEPDTSLFRGEAGLDEPYFQAAGLSGDAVVGPYCDALADPTCETGFQAKTFWNFEGQRMNGLSAYGYTFDYPIVSAGFRVDAADGTDCAAPGLTVFRGGISSFNPTTAWSSPGLPRPSSTITGSCENGTAHYDLTGNLDRYNRYANGFTNTVFGMVPGATTAEFDGGSARLDVYIAAIGYKYADPAADCGSGLLTPAHLSDDTPAYGGFVFDVWRSDLYDADLQWRTKITDLDSNDTEFTSPSREIADGANAVFSVDVPLADGRYNTGYVVTSGTSNFMFQESCWQTIDTSDPEFLSIDHSDGLPNHVGDTEQVKITVDDLGFPQTYPYDLSLTVTCLGGDVCPANRAKTITSERAVYFSLNLDSTVNQVVFTVTDKAGNTVASETVTVPATHQSYDYTESGTTGQGVMMVDESTGHLMLLESDWGSDLISRADLGGGWGKMDVVMAGDLTEDGNNDLLARDTKTGVLYTYPGNGDSGLRSRIQAGTGWNGISLFTSADDFDRDGKNDILAVDKASGKLYLYPGKGNGTFGSRVALDDGWGDFDSLTTMGDMDLDGRQDFLAHNSRTGKYHVYYGSPVSVFGFSMELHPSLAGASDARRYQQVTGVGDHNADNVTDLLAIDTRTGALVRLSLGANGSPLRSPVTIWEEPGNVRLPVVEADRTHDVDADGRSDLVARRSSNGTTYVYSGNGTGGFDGTVSVGTGLSGMNLVETAGDLNGDGFADLIARKSADGSLWLVPGKAGGGFGTLVKIGTGWNGMSAIVSGYDYNGDGRVDVIAREKSTGYLWLYKGQGGGAIGSRERIGTGWNAMREFTAAGDLDHDGNADVLAIRSSDNCMYFYGGRGNGTLKPGVKMSCSWTTGYDMVAAVGDFTGDGHDDWVARRKSDGALFLYRGNGSGGYGSRSQIGTGWNAMNIIA